MPSVISGDANVSATEFGYLDGVTSGLQSQINSKLNLAGGKILQVVSATHATQVTTTSTSYVTTSLAATITPSLATSRVLILANASALATGVGSQVVDFTLFRGTVAGTNLAGANVYFLRFGNVNGTAGMVALSHLDSPSTTSAQTYTLGFKVSSAALEGRVHVDGAVGTMTLLEVSA